MKFFTLELKNEENETLYFKQFSDLSMLFPNFWKEFRDKVNEIIFVPKEVRKDEI